MILQENMVVADRFRLVRMIGRGGMGSVWQAQHLGLDTPCAVKFIEGELANVAEAHARFEREARAAAQLRSPNVVQIMDHGVWQGMPYIAMELLEGEDLGKRLNRLASEGKRLTPAEVGVIIQQVCRALSKAHAAGVVHRDLKPDNIFLVKDDDREIVKILDFGVAKQTAQALDGSNTKTGAMLGTPYYMSPEQAQGIKSVDSRSDLWSLAVIVFQCLTGRLPFESEALGDLLVKIIVHPIPRPSDFGPVPPGFEAWWARAADRNPDARFQTAKEFSESLTQALGTSSITEMMTDRQRAQRMAGGTAMLANNPAQQIASNVANTPWPGQNQQQTAALMNTPHPRQEGTALMHAGMAPMPAPHGPNVTTGNPVAATFSGVDAPAIPKKGPPVAVFVGVGALALIGIILGGVALVSNKGKTANAGGDPSAVSASALATGTTGTAPTETATATATSTGEPTPSATETATAASAEPTATATATTTVAAGGPTHRPITPSTARTGTRPQPSATAATTSTAGKGKEKPINLGF